ncbi:MAG: cysteine desulfurase [Halobacteria archaeon]|nr:cysteine desulfurase [Halobacteria archaeon]
MTAEECPSPIDVEEVRRDFPALRREVNGERLVYLDNAATSQTPTQVVDAMNEYYERYNANVHRGLHEMSQEASIAYETAHDKVADFIGASSDEIVFTSNTTEAINTVAYGWGLDNLGEGDEVVLTGMEHHSGLLPWQQIAERTGADLVFLETDDHGFIEEGEIETKITEDAAMVSVIHMSNVFGTVTPVEEICDRAHEVGARCLVDAAQSVPHMPVDVGEIGCDFLAFSGHKMCGPTGSGVLYGSKEVLEETSPFEYGGEMIKKVTREEATWAEIPWKFEAGTPNVAEGIGLGRAVEYLEDIGMENIHEHEKMLAEYTVERLEEVDGVEVYGPSSNYEERGGVVSFNVEGAHAHDTSDILNDSGVAVRAGHHCVQPVMDQLDVAATARASFYLYNTREEADRFVEALEDVKEVFGA